MLPSTLVKTHVVTFRDSDDSVYITNETATKLSQFRNHPTAVSFPLVNGVTGTLIRDIGKYEVKSIHEIKSDEKESSMAAMRWICDCGRRNLIHIWPSDKCLCKGDKTKFLQKLHSKLTSLKNENTNRTSLFSP